MSTLSPTSPPHGSATQVTPPDQIRAPQPRTPPSRPRPARFADSLHSIAENSPSLDRVFSDQHPNTPVRITQAVSPVLSALSNNTSASHQFTTPPTRKEVRTLLLLLETSTGFPHMQALTPPPSQELAHYLAKTSRGN